jgi:L-alanine-DL-glutamate epimerase-like enolase superfamily enzyme
LKLEIESARLTLGEPLQTAYGVVAERELLLVALTGPEGITGHGEAAPLEPYDGVSTARVRAALERYARALAAAPGDANGAELLEACRREEDLPTALAAVEMALWDRAGRRRELPVAALIADNPPSGVAVNATIVATDRAGVAAEVAAAARAGYGCVKLKVGIGDDAGRVAAARAAAGPELALRLDANGAWDVEEAVSSIEALAPAGLELVEEPVHGLDGVRQVRDRVPVRVAIDETAGEHGALGAAAADAVCLKISRCGGIAPLLAAATLVRASGAEAYLGSNLDGPLGIAAAVHAAAALATRGPLAPCGLATLGMFEGVPDPLPVHEGEIPVPTGAGLGIDAS